MSADFEAQSRRSDHFFAPVAYWLGMVVLWGAFLSGGSAASASDLRSGAHALVGEDGTTNAVSGGVERVVSELEYHARSEGIEARAVNRAQALRTRFEPSGIRVHDWAGEAEVPLLRLSLARLGRNGALAAVPVGEVRRDANRVEIARPGIVEWFVNTPAGLEHGATLASRPAGTGHLVLDLAVEEAAAALRDGQVVFTTGAGRRLSYDHLLVLDAEGATVPAHMEVPDAKHVRLVVDDAGAAYPLTVDPLLSALADTKLESDDPSLGLGISVAGAGDVNGDGYADVVVGAHNWAAGVAFAGAVFVFHGGPGGLGSSPTELPVTVIESPTLLSRFGESVAGAGDVNGDGYADVIVGAARYDGGQYDEGAAFVYLGGPTGIPDGNPTTADTFLGCDQAGVEFGISVSSAGDVNGDGYADVIAGSRYYDVGAINSAGAAFVFHGGPGGIADGDTTDADSQILGEFTMGEVAKRVGEAGDLDGDGYSDVIIANNGSARVFHGGPLGLPAVVSVSSAETTILGTQPNLTLPWSVDGVGDVNGDGFGDLLVGARRSSSGQSQEGVAWLFLGSDLGIVDGDPANAEVQLESDEVGAWLGHAVGGAGDVDGDGFSDVVVGALDYDNGADEEGATFLYLGESDGVAPARLRQRRIGAGNGPVEPGGAVFQTDRIGVDYYADDLAGMAPRVKFEVEVCGVGMAFGDVSCVTSVSPTWVDLLPAGVDLAHTITGLGSDQLYSWRARPLYTASTSGEPASSTAGEWRRLRGRATPGDIRLVPEPGFGPSMTAALSAAALLAGRRRRRVA